MSPTSDPGPAREPARSPGLFDRVGLVLFRPKSPGNVGSVARAMKNMGFGRLLLADPIEVEDPAWFLDEAHRLAWNAADIVDARQVHASLPEALAPFTWILGTSSRPRPGAATLPPRDAAREIAAHLAANPDGRAAILLGQEDIGLTHEDQARCHRIGSIPVSTDYPSLNLAQAALLFLYETRLALLEPSPPAAAATPAAPEAARMEAFFARMESALDAIEFFEGTGRAHMMRELKGLFNRAVVDSRELAILEGIVHRIHLAATRAR